MGGHGVLLILVMYYARSPMRLSAHTVLACMEHTGQSHPACALNVLDNSCLFLQCIPQVNAYNLWFALPIEDGRAACRSEHYNGLASFGQEACPIHLTCCTASYTKDDTSIARRYNDMACK